MAVSADTTPAPAILPAPIPSLNRKQIADEIERLIAALDVLDGDVDLEDGADDEPSIGVSADGGDLELDTADAEPWLGWADNPNQVMIATERTEIEPDREADDDFEAIDEDGDDLDLGELDESDADSGETITGGGYRL